MKIIWLAAVLAAMAGCTSMGPVEYRDDPLARTNPALLNCPTNRAPVCKAQGGRTGKFYYDCSCR